MSNKIKSTELYFVKYNTIAFNKYLLNTYYLCIRITLSSGFEAINKTQTWPSRILEFGEGARKQRKMSS